MLSGEYIKDIL